MSPLHRLAVSFVVVSCVAGADWPQFRGPTQMGVSPSTKLPTTWDRTTNVSWQVPVPGKGWSSPVVANGTIVLTTAVEEGKVVSLRVLAFRSSDGQPLWDREIDKRPAADLPKNHPKNSYASPTCVIDGGKAYAHFGHIGTARLSLADGAIDWVNRELAYKPVHGNGGSPVVVDGKVIFAIDGADRQEVVALNANDGKVAWRTPRNTKPGRPFSFGTPTVVKLFDKSQLIIPGSDVVMALDPATGTEYWRFAYTGYSVVPRPVVADGLVYLATGYDSPKLLAVKPTPEGGTLPPSALAWKADKGAPLNPSMVTVGGLLFAVSDAGIANCWDAKTGEVKWSERVPDKYSSSILLANGLLYLTSETGTTTVLKAGPTFETVATNKLDEKMLSSIGVDGDALLVRTETTLFKIAGK